MKVFDIKGIGIVKTLVTFHSDLVGGLNPIEKLLIKLDHSPGRGENKKYLEPPPRQP